MWKPPCSREYNYDLLPIGFINHFTKIRETFRLHPLATYELNS